MPSSARLTQVCSSTSVRMWHNASGRLGVHSRMRGAASCQQDAAGCDRSAAGSVRCSAAAQTYASVAPPAFSAPPESQTTTFDLACPICADTKFELHADRCAAVTSANGRASWDVCINHYELAQFLMQDRKSFLLMSQGARAAALLALRPHLQHRPRQLCGPHTDQRRDAARL